MPIILMGVLFGLAMDYQVFLVSRMREDFVGAVGLNRVARFRLDPRDKRTDADYYEIVGDDDGVFGCMTLLACHDVCPKELPLATQIAYLRRKMMRQGL